MDVSTSLQAVVLRQASEAAERAAQHRVERQRDDAAQPPVRYGQAETHAAKTKRTRAPDPAAVSDKARRQPLGQHVDLKA